ncbi:MAG: hypothetical protein AAGG07_10495 [Planctomycetota bacterium]
MDAGVAVFMIPISAIIGVFTMITISAIVDAKRRTEERRELEESRRELAAYVAEGSITPKDAELILRSDPDKAGKRK